MRANTVCAILGVFIFMTSATAMGGTLASDPNPVVWNEETWQGTEYLDDGSNLSATVDWVVLHEDDWTYGGYSPEEDPSFPGLPVYVYAYQVWNTNSDDVMRFFVSTLPSSEARNIGTFTVDVGDAAAVAPDNGVGLEGTPPNSANWRWEDGEGRGLLNGEHSIGLAYSSVNMPITSFLAMGSVVNGGSSASWLMATPGSEIPEPASMALVAFGALALLHRRRR